MRCKCKQIWSCLLLAFYYLNYCSHTIRNDTIWDRIVFKKVQQALGGKVRFIATGSAPLSPIVLKFLRCIVGCPVRIFFFCHGQKCSFLISNLFSLNCRLYLFICCALIRQFQGLILLS